jgi:hypothetical protein
MTAPVRISRVTVSALATVPHETIELNMGYLPWVLGDSLAAQVHAHVGSARLGYYPALDYFRDPATGVDGSLILLIDEIAEFCSQYSRRELRRRLSGAFSNIRFDQVHCTAYTMPRIHPGQIQSLSDLGRHYAPSTIRLGLLLSTIERVPMPEPDKLACAKLTRCADEAFTCLEILDAHTFES